MCPSSPPEPTRFRAFLNLGVGRYLPEKAGGCRYDYLVSMDLKGMMPTYLVNQVCPLPASGVAAFQVMGKMVLSDVDNHRKKAEEYGKQGPAH